MKNPEYPLLILKKGKEKSIYRRHPWVFSGAFAKIPKDLDDGDKIYVCDRHKNILATAYFGLGSITARILDFTRVSIDAKFYEDKISKALALRQKLNLANSESTNAYRLIHGEGDGVPGLIIDIYNKVAVIQSHSQGIERDKELISEAVNKVLEGKIQRVHIRSAEKNEESGASEQVIEVKEHGHKFRVDYISGQKTGFFIDQRENRNLLAQYSKAQKILNAFSYSGGFSIYALKAGAAEVHSLDSSKSAIELVESNLEANSLSNANHKCITRDALAYINSGKAKKEAYDIIVLDPPAFAKHKSARHQAIQAYKRLNARAMNIMKKDSILFTFSCSQVVTPDLFYNTIRAAAIETGKTVQILHHLHQPADHPVSMYHPEGEYLKGLVLRVV